MFSSNYDLSTAQVCMTLAGMAYAGDAADISALLADPGYATGNNWQLVWYGATPDNLMYMVQDRQQPENYVITIRGTVWGKIEDLIEDLDVFVTTPWPYGPGQVSNGILKGITALQNLTNTSGQTLFDFLQQQNNGTLQITVTGHSLGGALAGAYALYLQQALTLPATWQIYTFAAPTVGDATFVNHYSSVFDTNAFRIFNNKDIVPHGFGDLTTIISEQVPVALGFLMSLMVGVILKTVEDKLTEKQISYVQPSLPDTVISLDNSLHPVPPLPPVTLTSPAKTLAELEPWFAYQHSHQTYLQLLDTTPLPSVVPAITEGNSLVAV